MIDVWSDPSSSRSVLDEMAARVAARHMAKLARGVPGAADVLRRMRSLSSWWGSEGLRKFELPLAGNPSSYGIVKDPDTGLFWATVTTARRDERHFIDPEGTTQRSRALAFLHESEQVALDAAMKHAGDALRRYGVEAPAAEEPASGSSRWWPFGRNASDRLLLQPENATERYHTRQLRTEEKKNLYEVRVVTQPTDEGTIQVWMTGPGPYGGVRTVTPPRGSPQWLNRQFWGLAGFMEHLLNTAHADDYVTFQHWTARPTGRTTPRDAGGVEWQVLVPINDTPSRR